MSCQGLGGFAAWPSSVRSVVNKGLQRQVVVICTVPAPVKGEDSPMSTAIAHAQAEIPMCLTTRLC